MVAVSASSPGARTLRGVLLAALLTTLLAACGMAPSAGEPGLRSLRGAQERLPDGRLQDLALPMDRSGGAGDQAAPRVQLLLKLHFDAAPRDQALYIPGLIGHARIAVNGHVLEDHLARAGQPVPRSVHRIRLLRMPDALLHAGDNTLAIDLAAPRYLSLSPLHVGHADDAEAAYEARVLGVVIGPSIVAIIMSCLGLCVLVLWLRRRHDPLHACFGGAALAWGLHSGWTLLPRSPLTGVHHVVWWTSLYAAFVVLLVMFSLRFSGLRLPRTERLLWGLMAVAAPLLYLADLGGVVLTVAEAWLAGCIVLVAATLALVVLQARRRRDTASVLMVAAGAASLAFGMRDWWVSHTGADNNPVYLTPYAGLMFVVLVSWMLVDGFVRASRRVEALNSDLARRVERASTRLRQALADTQAARLRAEEASRAKTQFLAAASHDLRQPVHALALTLASLPQRGLPQPVQAGLLRMRSSLVALGRMFDALLDLSRIDAGAVQPDPADIDLGALLRRLGDECAPQAEARGLRLVLREGTGPSPPPPARADALLLERVLRNLLANAVQHTRQGGVLLRWRLCDGGTRWLLQVWDSGCGIAAHEQPRVFDEFYQVRDGNGVRPEAGGLGLGLAIVKRLCALMDLPLDLCSRPGHGTRFSLRLPVAPGPATAPVRDRASAPVAWVPGRVVLVEDDAAVRAATTELLRRWGCPVLDGADADAVLRAWRVAGRPRVQAIVADFRLRHAHNGLQAVAQLRQALGAPGLPAVIVSGGPPSRRPAQGPGADLTWLSKPVPAERLRQWLAHALSLQQEEPA